MGNDNNTEKGSNKAVIIAIIIILAPIILPAIAVLVFLLYYGSLKPAYTEKVTLPQIEKEAKEYVHNTYNCDYNDMTVYDIQDEFDTWYLTTPKKATVKCGDKTYKVYYHSKLGWVDESIEADDIASDKKSPKYKTYVENIKPKVDTIISKYTNKYFTKCIIDEYESGKYSNYHGLAIFIDASEYDIQEIVSLMNNITNEMGVNEVPLTNIIYSLVLFNNSEMYEKWNTRQGTFSIKSNDPEKVFRHLGYIENDIFVDTLGNFHSLSKAEQILSACKNLTTDTNCGDYNNKAIYYSNANSQWFKLFGLEGYEEQEDDLFY